MLFKHAVLEKIVSGDITVAFRRWRRPAVRPGSRLRTALGVLEVDSVRIVEPVEVTAEDARRAGFADPTRLLATLDRREGDLYRIELRYRGPDDRAVLGAQAVLDEETMAGLGKRLERLDRNGRSGAWTRRVLAAIAEEPGRRARDLAARLGREPVEFKRDVRKLKDLGLTESLATGYRLSPRGLAYLRNEGS